MVDQHEADLGSGHEEHIELPYDFATAHQLLALTQAQRLSIAELMMANERMWRKEVDIREGD